MKHKAKAQTEINRVITVHLEGDEYVMDQTKGIVTINERLRVRYDVAGFAERYLPIMESWPLQINEEGSDHHSIYILVSENGHAVQGHFFTNAFPDGFEDFAREVSRIKPEKDVPGDPDINPRYAYDIICMGGDHLSCYVEMPLAGEVGRAVAERNAFFDKYAPIVAGWPNILDPTDEVRDEARALREKNPQADTDAIRKTLPNVNGYWLVGLAVYEYGREIAFHRFVHDFPEGCGDFLRSLKKMVRKDKTISKYSFKI